MSQTLISSKYQLVIPKEIRKRIGIKPGQKLNITLAGDNIILTPKREWPEDHLKDLRNLWKKTNIKVFLKDERNSWE